MERADSGIPPRSPIRQIREVRLTEGDLTLRAIRRDEVALYAAWWEDPEVCFGFCSEARSAESILDAFAELEQEAGDIGHWIDWVIEFAGKPIGMIWFSHWDLETAGIDMNILIGEPDCRGRGVARRAIRLLAGWAFEAMALKEIYLCPREDHVPAIRCYQSVGAKLGPIRQDVVQWRGETVCFREMCMTPGDLRRD